MVKLEWGTKRTCLGCSARFYDLQRKPITCPKCNTVLELASTTRRGRKAAAAAPDLGVIPIVVDEDVLIDQDIDLGVELEGDDDTLIEEDDDLSEDLDTVSESIIEEEEE